MVDEILLNQSVRQELASIDPAIPVEVHQSYSSQFDISLHNGSERLLFNSSSD